MQSAFHQADKTQQSLLSSIGAVLKENGANGSACLVWKFTCSQGKKGSRFCWKGKRETTISPLAEQNEKHVSSHPDFLYWYWIRTMFCLEKEAANTFSLWHFKLCNGTVHLYSRITWETASKIISRPLCSHYGIIILMKSLLGLSRYRVTRTG